ncbi:2'-5' RNA ligase family protein [Hyphococcus sp.]|jgi:2'-5' RNA ligase|uniref:2'-5' RNA ligase family protein n=1 Tax=Hyphococcus sp. TaxID=2038636 RepID=UPI003D096D02
MTAKRLNLFFALFPEEEAAQKLEALAEELRAAHHLKGRPFLADHFHVSLQNLGGYDLAKIDSAGRAAESIKAEPFTVCFSTAQSWTKKSDGFPLVLLCNEGEAPLLGLYRQLGLALKQEGLNRYASFDFTPHITLLYAHGLTEESHPTKEPIGWQVKEFALVASHVGETRYDFLGQWPLRGGA